MEGTHESDPAKRATAAKRITDQMRGFTMHPCPIESLGSSIRMPELRAEAEQAIESATFENRTLTVLKVAKYRSTRCALASGVFCHAVGMRGAARSLYEGARLLHPLKQQ